MKIQLPPLDVVLVLKFGFIFGCVFFAAFIGTGCSFLESAGIALVAFASAIFLNKTEKVLSPIKDMIKGSLQIEEPPSAPPSPSSPHAPPSSPVSPLKNAANAENSENNSPQTPQKVIRVSK
jgi:hypothetical protein